MTRRVALLETEAPGVEQPRRLAAMALRLILGLVGAHSILLGFTIYEWPDWVSLHVFAVEPKSPFFLRQAGVFLVCLGCVYWFPALNLARYHRLVILVIGTKITAVLFLIGNARLTPAPLIIGWAALGDGLMALSLLLAYGLARSTRSKRGRDTLGKVDDLPG